ncbi:MAG: HNH endonuclease [Burkholderiales bacterium]|nr:HNH endonuclease [Phycisphaerae bacterium]
MTKVLADLVVARAAARCEYCLLPASISPIPFHIEHIVARIHGGETNEANLAYACMRCNCHKGTNLGTVDALTQQHTRLFNPRHDRWREHFTLAGHSIVGLTQVGRATVQLLRMNDLPRQALRAEAIRQRIWVMPVT